MTSFSTPFTTCGHCNTLNILEGEDFEQLPQCIGCGHSLHLRLGVHIDLKPPIAIIAERTGRREALEHGSAVLIQSVVRKHQAKGVLPRLRQEKAAVQASRKRSAILFQSLFRGFSLRKCARVKKALRDIKACKKKTLHDALNWNFSKKGAVRRHVFWYTTPDEIQLLYRDYRLLVKRSGNFPPLNVVEANILEVHRRIHLLRHEAATRIQSCVRGLLARHYVRLVCSQRAAAETRRVRAAIAIQCAIRRLFGVRKVARRRTEHANERAAAALAAERAAKVRLGDKKSLLHMSKLAYKHEWHHVRAGQVLGKLPYGQVANTLEPIGLPKRGILAPHKQVCEWVNVGQQEEQNKIQAAWERNQTIARIQEAKPGFKSAKYFEMDPLGVPRPSLRERRAEKIRQQVRHSAVDLRKISSVFPTILPALPPASAQESSEPEEFTGF